MHDDTIKIMQPFMENMSSTIKIIMALNKYEDNHFQEAIETFKSINNYQNDEEILYYIGNCYLFDNIMNERIQSPNASIKISQSEFIIWDSNRDALDTLFKYEKAIASYDKAIEINPNYTAAWYQKGMVLSKLNKYEEARFCYSKAEELYAKELSTNDY